MSELKVSENPNETQTIAETLDENLKKFNVSKVGPYECKTFVVYTNSAAGDLIAGIKGAVLEQICMVHTVWVDESHRKQGLGTQLFKKLEAFAKRKGCTIIQLDTAEFQAKGFYEKIGFSVVATLPENFKGYTTYILRKLI